MQVKVTKEMVLHLDDLDARCLWDIANMGEKVADLVAEYGSRGSLRKPISEFLDELWEALEENGIKGVEYERKA